MFTDSFPYCCRIGMALQKEKKKKWHVSNTSLKSHRKTSTYEVSTNRLTSSSVAFNSLPYSSSIQCIDPEGSMMERRQEVHRVQFEQN